MDFQFNWYYLLALPLYKFIAKAINLYRVNSIYENYIDWLMQDNKLVYNLFGKKTLLKDFAKKAKIDNIYIPLVRPVGYGQIVNSTYSVIDNFPSRLEADATIVNRLLLELKGFFKEQMIQAINPIYWINAMIFLPSTITQYLGIKEDNIFNKLFQLIAWIISAILIALYPDACRSLIEKLLAKMN